MELESRSIKMRLLTCLGFREDRISERIKEIRSRGHQGSALAKRMGGSILKTRGWKAGVSYYSTVLPCQLKNSRLRRSQPQASGTIKLSPWFITGFSDAEGCFGFNISKSSKHSIGWNISAYFAINIHSKDKPILDLIRAQLGDIGHINIYGSMCVFRVSSKKQLVEVVIPHFDQYFLMTNKRADYLLWKEGVLMLHSGGGSKG